MCLHLLWHPKSSNFYQANCLFISFQLIATKDVFHVENKKALVIISYCQTRLNSEKVIFAKHVYLGFKQ